MIGDAFAIETHQLTRRYESLRAVDGLENLLLSARLYEGVAVRLYPRLGE
ncbi:MAG TPA: hypothetical protein VN757_10195 [Steroidobacteraceae bacterium]|nr:hypothetical protein [Steroidobacteraceae bacterium]